MAASKFATAFMASGLLVAVIPAHADVVRVDTGTWFKKSAVDSTTLASSDKCLASAGSRLGAGARSSIVNAHYAATLDAPMAGCGFSTGYFYAPHVTWLNDPVAAPAANSAQHWFTGSLGTNQKVADDNLSPITFSLGGNKIWKSNNPEIFNGTGWLMQNSRVDSVRGGQANPLTGCINAYYFHINQTGGTAFLHLLASNPQSSAITISAKGSTYTNSTKPLNGAGTGQSYWVAKDWRDGVFPINFSGRSVASQGATEIAKLSMAPNNMADGRFEVCASAGIYLYTVVTTTGDTVDAINKSQGSAAAGEIHAPSATTFGREGGVYNNSIIAGLTEVVLPGSSGQYLGFELNTTAKYNLNLQEQTSLFNTRLSDSTTRTYGNYGHKFDTTLRLFNTSGSDRSVRISIAGSLTGTSNTPSFTLSTPASLNGVNFAVYLTPTQPRQVIGSYTVPANGFFDARLAMFVAGLGVANQQLIVETL